MHTYPTYPVPLNEMLEILKNLGFTKLERDNDIYDIDTFDYETDNEFLYLIEEKSILEYNSAVEYTGTCFNCLK